MNKIEEILRLIQNDIAYLKENVGTLKTGQNELILGQKILKKNQEELKASQEELKIRQERLELRQLRLEGNQEAMREEFTNELRKTNQRLAVFQEEFTKKVNILLDADKARQDLLEIHDSEISEVKEKQFEHTTRINILEKKVIGA